MKGARPEANHSARWNFDWSKADVIFTLLFIIVPACILGGLVWWAITNPYVEPDYHAEELAEIAAFIPACPESGLVHHETPTGRYDYLSHQDFHKEYESKGWHRIGERYEGAYGPSRHFVYGDCDL